ncbi:variant leucine-rich repeat-containing protein [Mobiluncus mulieris]|uniref:variant leucine-rich repeat-containing protein n=1 Tax=Mobiluncus mulieris TaxID=2052 RepID=UPI0021E2FF16|nr:hypothetical protein [Mobiluncus mulieris]MCV0001922.1 hypothetical protein [Mobiluncus mulieris]
MSDMNQKKRASDPTTPATELQQLATDPDLRPLIAKNPAAYPELLAWLASKNEPAVTAALQEREAMSPSLSVFPIHEVPSAEATLSNDAPLVSGETPDTPHNPVAPSPDSETPDSGSPMPEEPNTQSAPQRTSILGGYTAGATPDNHPDATTILPAQDSDHAGNPPRDTESTAAAGTAATAETGTPNYPDASATAAPLATAGGETAGYYPTNLEVSTPPASPASPNTPAGYVANSTGSYAPGTPGVSGTYVAPGTPAGAPPAYPAPAGYAPGAPGAYPAYPTAGSVPVMAMPAAAAQKSKSNTVLWVIFAVLLAAVVGLAVVVLMTFLGTTSETAAPKETTTTQTTDEDPAKAKDKDKDANKDKDDKSQKPKEREVRFPAPAGAQSATAFTTKTGNTTCSASGNTLTCAVKDHEAQIGNCDSQTSAVVTIQDGNPEISCQMKEQYSPGGVVPDYNQSVNLGDFVCTSLYDYTECWNIYTGAGFQLARQMYQSVQH